MTTLMEQHFDRLQMLIRDAQRKRIEPEPFADKFLGGISKLAKMLKNNLSPGLLNAYSELTRMVLEYKNNPDLAGIGKIGNKLVRYKTEATQIH